VRISDKLTVKWGEGTDSFLSANKTNLKEVFSIISVKWARRSFTKYYIKTYDQLLHVHERY